MLQTIRREAYTVINKAYQIKGTSENTRREVESSLVEAIGLVVEELAAQRRGGGAVELYLQDIRSTANRLEERVRAMEENIEEKLNIVEEKMEEKFEKMEEKFEKMEEKFENIEENIEERVRAMKEKIEEKLNIVEEKMEEKFEKMEEKVLTTL